MKNYELSLTLALAVVLPSLARGDSIYVNTTSSAGWAVTGGGAVDATPFVVSNWGNYHEQSVIALTSTGNDVGMFVSGGSLANFNGFWTATYSFTLPSDATAVQFSYSEFFGDDRGVMRLNGAIVGSAGLPTSPGDYSGVMVFTDGGLPQPYTFNGPYGYVSGTVTSGFNIGGTNTLQFIINNTGIGIDGTMHGDLAWNDGTGLGIKGTISYAIVPEPSVLAVLGLAGLFVLRASRARR